VATVSRTPGAHLARLKVEHPAWTIRATAEDSPQEPGWAAERPGGSIRALTLDALEIKLIEHRRET
jgi:hypothetical protein